MIEANYAYSPGYYADSLVKCDSDVLRGQTITITCKRENERFSISCDDYIFAHDTAHIECKPGYEYPKVTGIKTTIECLPNGKWSAPIFECVSMCGRVTKKAKALVIHGNQAEVSEFPWNVAIYLLNVLVCGGSIITERVFLSAGGCECLYAIISIIFSTLQPIALQERHRKDWNVIPLKIMRLSLENIFET